MASMKSMAAVPPFDRMTSNADSEISNSMLTFNQVNGFGVPRV